jgi:hypothetical protein
VLDGLGTRNDLAPAADRSAHNSRTPAERVQLKG